MKQHRQTVEDFYGEDVVEGSIFSRTSPGYLSLKELDSYDLTKEEEKKYQKILQDNPPYFKVNTEKQGSKLIGVTLDKLNISPRVSSEGYSSIRWFSTGFEVYDLINDLKEVFNV